METAKITSGDGSKAAARLSPLDSLRGIAAMAVMLSHCFPLDRGTYLASRHTIGYALHSISGTLFYFIGRLVEGGRSAVMLFFVLSGFVLTHSLLARPLPYAGYVIRRTLRIYPVFLFTVLYSYVLHHFITVQNLPATGNLKDLLDLPAISFGTLFQHVLMFGTNGSDILDPPMWSIVHEMRISLLFPLLLLSVIRFRWFAIAACFLLSLACTYTILHTTGMIAIGVFDATVARSLISTGYFVIFFACGAFLAIERERAVTLVQRLARWQKAALLVFCLCCFIKADADRFHFAGAIIDYLRGISALALIALALGSRRFATALAHRTFLWLGRISYSLYLVHFVIMFVVHALNETLGKPVSIWSANIIVVVLSLLVADSITRSVEQPFIALGTRLSARMVIPGLHRRPMRFTKSAAGL